MRRAWLLAGTAVLALLVGLLVRLPADRAVAWAAPADLELRGVRGTLWAGRAASLEHRGGVPVTDLEWDVAAWQLLAGRVAADVRLDLAGLDLRGRVVRGLGGELRLHEARLRGPAAGLGPLAPGVGLRLGGELLGRVRDAVLAEGRITRLAGRLQWEDAAVVAPLALELGRVRIEAGEPPQGAAARLAISGEGGALEIEGSVDLQPDGRYRADIRLRPTARAPQGLGDTLGMFARREGDAFRVRDSGRLPALAGD